MLSKKFPRTVAALAVIGLAGFGLAACAGGSEDDGADKSPAPQASVDYETLKDGVLTVASQGNYLPMEYQEEGETEWKGASADLLTEAASRIGLKVEYVYSEYSLLLSGLEAGRSDVASGGMAPNAERIESADFISYMKSGPSYLVRAEDEKKFKKPLDMCGFTVGTPRGSANVELGIGNENKKCVDAGKPEMKLETFDTTANGLQSLTAGRIDAYLPDTVQGYQIIEQTPGEFALVADGYQIISWYCGWGFEKGTHELLREDLEASLQEMIDDGTYAKILKKYGVEDMGLEKPLLNELPALPDAS